jgi:RNA-directed DNA polymerase
VGWGVRLGVLALRLGGFFGILAAGAWAVVAMFGLDQLPVAGWLSVAWAISVIAIAVLVGLRRRPVLGVLGILSGLWVLVFAIGLATRPTAEDGNQFGNFWLAMGSVGILVAGLSGASSSDPLRWFGRALAIVWLIGAIASIGGAPFSVPVGSLDEEDLRPVAIQWVSLAAFAVWSLWSARWLATDMSLDRSRTARLDLASDEEVQKAWLPYGPWPRRLARVTAVLAVLIMIPLALDRFGGIAELGAFRMEIILGLFLATFAFVVGRSTPRLGHTRFELFTWVPHVSLLFGLTEAGVLGGLGLWADGSGEGIFDEQRTDLMALFPSALIGTWTVRVAFRERGRQRRLGLVGGMGLLVGGLVGTVLAESGEPVVLPGLAIAGSFAVVGAWIWQLGSQLSPGVARPATIFALPGISSETAPPIPPVSAPEPARLRPATTALSAGYVVPLQVPAAFTFEAESRTRFDIEELAKRTGLTVSELRAARPTYRRVPVPKRSGGTRELLVPDDATKVLQRRLLRRVLARVPVHPAAHGFERGRSIVSNAAPHTGRTVVVRMDVIEFFGTTSVRRVRRLFRVLGWDAETAELLTRLTTHDGGLPTGAPTSPRLANLVNVLLDARLTGLAEALGARYTRYADDLTFSFDGDDHAALVDLLGATRRIARAHGYRLHVERKLQIRRRHHRQTVTGLVVNERVALPRQRRRWLRAVEHRIYSGREATLTREQLTGWQALESMVEAPGVDPQPAERVQIRP